MCKETQTSVLSELKQLGLRGPVKILFFFQILFFFSF